MKDHENRITFLFEFYLEISDEFDKRSKSMCIFYTQFFSHTLEFHQFNKLCDYKNNKMERVREGHNIS